MQDLKDRKVVKRRLGSLKTAFASSAIEGIHVSPEDRRKLEALVKKGATPDEMVMAIKQEMGLV